MESRGQLARKANKVRLARRVRKDLPASVVSKVCKAPLGQ